LFARHLQPRIAREGVAVGIWLTLRMLWDEDGMTQCELGERVGTNGPTIVMALNSMERAGLGQARAKSDRLAQDQRLFDRARAKVENKLWPMAAEVLALSLSGLTRKQVQLLKKMLTQIRENLQSDYFG